MPSQPLQPGFKQQPLAPYQGFLETAHPNDGTFLGFGADALQGMTKPLVVIEARYLQGVHAALGDVLPVIRYHATLQADPVP